MSVPARPKANSAFTESSLRKVRKRPILLPSTEPAAISWLITMITTIKREREGHSLCFAREREREREIANRNYSRRCIKSKLRVYLPYHFQTNVTECASFIGTHEKRKRQRASPRDVTLVYWYSVINIPFVPFTYSLLISSPSVYIFLFPACTIHPSLLLDFSSLILPLILARFLSPFHSQSFSIAPSFTLSSFPSTLLCMTYFHTPRVSLVSLTCLFV